MEAESFRDRSGRVRDIGITTAMYGRVFIVALTLVAALAQALTYGLGGALALNGAMEPGAVVSLALLLSRLYGPLMALSNVRVDVMSALVSFERVFEVLDLKPLIIEKPDAGALPAGEQSVEFRDVHFAYPGADEVSLASLEDVAVNDHSPRHPVLHGVSFTARAGELVALVGPSGAGKTTISQLVPRIYDVDTGAVLVGGHDVRDVTLQSLRDAIGVVAQDAHLFHDTIRANLLYARPEATEAELVAALRAAQIWDLVAGCPKGLGTVVGDRGHRLSGGEKQRLAIARVLLKAPGVVILDEATAHLDSRVGGRGAAGAGRGAARPHVVGDRPPAVHHPQRRPDRRRRRRPGRAVRHPRRAARRGRALLRAVPDPVPEPGRRSRRGRVPGLTSPRTRTAPRRGAESVPGPAGIHDPMPGYRLPDPLPARPLADPRAVLRGATYRITVLTDGLLRLEYADDGVFEDRASAFALHRELPVPEFTVRETGDALEVVTDRLHLVYDRGPFTHQRADRPGPRQHHQLPLGVALRRAGRTIWAAPRAPWTRSTAASRSSPGSRPANGFAVLDDSRPPAPGGDGWVAPAAARPHRPLRLRLRPRLRRARSRRSTPCPGHPPVLPRWALGNWWSRYHRYTADGYLELIDRFEAEGVPFSVAVIDMDWHWSIVDPEYGSGWTGYTWNRDLFPDPAAFLAELHAAACASP